MPLRPTHFLLALASIGIGATTLAADSAAPMEVQAESVVKSSVISEELAVLANEVNLPAWTRLAMSSDFSSIEEGWVAVYSPKDIVGAAQDWSPQVKEARTLAGRATKAGDRQWINLFITAGEAVSRRDPVRFAAALRALDGAASPGRIALASNRNIFTAK